jgi:hypothetical protein
LHSLWQGPVSIGSIMRAPSYAIDHHRSKPAPEPILHRATERRCFCGMLVAATTDPRRDALSRVPWLAVSDPKARSALHTRKGVRSTVHIKPRPNQRHCTVCPSVALVAAVTGILLRHGRLQAERNEPPGTLVANPKFPPCILVSTGKTQPG